MNDDRITVRFPAELRKRLKAGVHLTGTRQSDLVRSAVERQLEVDEDMLTPYEHAEATGLIGAVSGAIRDLSTNPKYFDDFGAK